MTGVADRSGGGTAGASSIPTVPRVVVAEDDVLLREGLASLLNRRGFDVVGQCGTPSDLLDLVRTEEPDLAMIDIRMPPEHTTEGLDAARVIREQIPATAILVLSAHAEVDEATDFIGGGPRSGYLLKSRVTDVDDFVGSLERIVNGARSSTPRSSRSWSRRGGCTIRSTCCRRVNAKSSRSWRKVGRTRGSHASSSSPRVRSKNTCTAS